MTSVETPNATITDDTQKDNPGTVKHFSQGFKNKLINADCFDVFPQIPDNSVDLILCDLPYGTTACKWDCILPFEPLWEQYKRIIKPNSAIVLTASQPFTTKLILSGFELFKYCWYWQKSKPTGWQQSKNKPMRVIEEICVFSQAPVKSSNGLGDKLRMEYYPQGVESKGFRTMTGNEYSNVTGFRPNQKGKQYEAFTGFPHNLLTFSSERGLHPTQKPVALFEYLIKTYTNPNALILDNCSGSATTAIAAINTNRNFICIEKDSDYHQTALNRVNAHINILLEKAKKNT